MDKTKDAVCRQVGVMGCEVFEIGLFQPSAKPAMIPRVWDRDTLNRSIRWLKHENLSGRNIYIRPNGEHHLTLVDDLTAHAVTAMKLSGFQPTLVIETSPGNYQAWLRHPERLSKELGTAAARKLAEQFGGDTGAADWRHFGRLAGFTNRKHKYQDPATGRHPFVEIVEATGKIYPEAARFLLRLRAQLHREQENRRRTAERCAARTSQCPQETKPIEAFRPDPKYLGDHTRIDLAYAVYALSHGVDRAAVSSAIRSRDLSHKGNERRQNEYVQRTVEKALRTIEGIGRDR